MGNFNIFLKNFKKSNGDKLLSSTLEQYSTYYKKYEEDIIKFDNDEELVNYMNGMLERKPDMRLYSMFRLYLIFSNHNPHNKNDEILKKLITPETSSGVMGSIRQLQSKLLSVQEVKKLLEKSDLEWQLYFRLLYDTACRRNEILNIKYEDVVFKNLPQDKEDIDNRIYAEIEVLGKGYKKRKVYLTKPTVELIKIFMRDKNKENKIIEFKMNDGKVYIKQDDELRKRIMKKCNEVLSRHVHPHCFRHTKLQHMADVEVPVLEIKSYAGHSDINATMVYVKNSLVQGKKGFVKSAGVI